MTRLATSTAVLQPEPADDRRAAPRYRILQRCLVLPEGATGAANWHGIAYNISTTGLGLTLGCYLRPGTELFVEPWQRPGAPAVRVRIVRSEPVEFTWFHGCELLKPLTAQELRHWAGAP